MSLIEALKKFSTFLLKYQGNFSGVTQSILGSFKRNQNKDFYTPLYETAGFDLSMLNIHQFYMKALNKLMETEDPPLEVLRFIKVIVSKKPSFGKDIASCSFNNYDELLALIQTYEEQFRNELSDIVIETQVIADTPPQAQSTNFAGTQDQNNIVNTNTLMNQMNSDHSVTIDSIKSLLDDFKSSLNTTISSQIRENLTEQISRQFGVEKKLSSDQIQEYVNKIEHVFKKILIKENNIKLMKTHLEKKTTPKCLSHRNYPNPYLWDDKIFVERYNNITATHQNATMHLIQERLLEQTTMLNNDIEIYKNILTNHIDEIDLLINETKINEENKLKKSFEASHNKCLKIILEPFKPRDKKSNNNKPKRYQNKSNNNDNEWITDSDSETPSNNKYKNNNKNKRGVKSKTKSKRPTNVNTTQQNSTRSTDKAKNQRSNNNQQGPRFPRANIPQQNTTASGYNRPVQQQYTTAPGYNRTVQQPQTSTGYNGPVQQQARYNQGNFMQAQQWNQYANFQQQPQSHSRR
jgi:hypothetical protein